MSSLFLSGRPRRARRGGAAALALGLSLLLASCDGSNLFTEPVGGGGEAGADRSAPTVEFEYPRPDTVVTIAPLDSVLARFRVRDNRGVTQVQLSGFALRGDASLGNQTAVERFATKTIRLDSIGRISRDTTLTRFLLATRDSLPESRVYVVATAKDSAGNVGADTVTVAIGGPRVQVVSPTADSAFRAGTSLPVRVSAEDRADLIGSIRIRTTGAFQRDTTLTLQTPLRLVDTTIVIPIPPGAQGDLEIVPTATSGRRLVGEGRPLRVRISAGGADNVAPRVSFTQVVPARLEVSDSLTVTVTGVDETRVDTLGATVVAVRRSAAREDTLGVLTRKVAVAPPTGTATLRLSLAPLGLTGLDTMTVSFEVVAFARDGAGNCAAATSPGVTQSLPCRTVRGATVTQGAGALTTASLVRGRTVLPPVAGDALVDLVSDRRHVYVSNRSRNRVEVLPVGSLAYSGSVLVGSQPWGLAMSPDSATLLVANSGGAGSISQVPLTAAGAGAEDRGRRIVTDNVVVYVVKFSIDESGRIDLTITDRDFSDRPQFLAQTASGRIVYSTVPTPSAPDGTVQEYSNRGAASATDIFVEYARGFVPGQFVVRRADNVTKVIQGTGEEANDQLVVCDHAPGQAPGSLCFPSNPSQVMSFQQIQEALAASGSDALIDYAVDPNLIGLSDTTFLAVSKDHKTIAVGEGERSVGRILAFAENSTGAVVNIGNTRDLVNNASDRVIGLALNRDGTTGVARGQSTYFFRRDLRQLGNRVVSGSPTGGVALHPDHPNVTLGFVSGQDEAGRPFVDVVDTFHFQVVRRIYIRNPVVGSMTAVSTGSASGVVVRLYAITGSGVVAIDLTQADLQ